MTVIDASDGSPDMPNYNATTVPHPLPPKNMEEGPRPGARSPIPTLGLGLPLPFIPKNYAKAEQPCFGSAWIWAVSPNFPIFPFFPLKTAHPSRGTTRTASNSLTSPPPREPIFPNFPFFPFISHPLGKLFGLSNYTNPIPLCPRLF